MQFQLYLQLVFWGHSLEFWLQYLNLTHHQIINAGLKQYYTRSKNCFCNINLRPWRKRNSALHAKEYSEVAEVGPEDILTAIQKGTNQANEQITNLLMQFLVKMTEVLNNQMRLMRQDLNDFAKTVAEANTTAFIDALKASNC